MVCFFRSGPPRRSSGTMPFQEADKHRAQPSPARKYNFLVKDVNDLAQNIKEAFYIASHRQTRSPCWWIFPKIFSMGQDRI